MVPGERPSRSQVFDLIIGLLELHGFQSSEAQAAIFGVTATTIQNWKSGRVQTLNSGRLEEVRAQLHFLSKRRGVDLVGEPSLCPIVIEEGAGPEDLEQELSDRWRSVYLGHKFLYYHPAGAIDWINLLETGYGNTQLIRGFVSALKEALGGDGSAAAKASNRGKLAAALHWDQSKSCGVDLISLGPGDGAKEARAIELLIDHAGPKKHLINWLTYTPVDVSIPLLRMASANARNLIREKVEDERWPHFLVRPSCSDFEDGNIGFTNHLSEAGGDRRLVLFLGGTFGNLRSEAAFLERAASRILRQGDMMWLEVGVRQARIEDDPLFANDLGGAQETVRRSLVEGPHRRFRASVGAPLDSKMQIIPRDGGQTCEVPQSYNFHHDVNIDARGRCCSVLYSRRYDVAALRNWLKGFGYRTLFEHIVKDNDGRDRTAHILIRRDS